MCLDAALCIGYSDPSQYLDLRATGRKGILLTGLPAMPSLLLLLLLATLTPLTSVAEALETPKELHKHAIKLAQVEQLAESLPYFRAAVRAAPANVRYISDLGVTEMRLHDFEKAGMRFLEANYLSDGLYTNAVENMQELQSFMSSTEWSALELRWWSSRNFVSSPPDRQRHSVSPLPTITYASMLDPSNRTAANYLLGDHPYLLTGAMESWNLDNFAPSSLTDHFGASRVDYYPHNMQVRRAERDSLANGASNALSRTQQLPCSHMCVGARKRRVPSSSEEQRPASRAAQNKRPAKGQKSAQTDSLSRTTGSKRCPFAIIPHHPTPG